MMRSSERAALILLGSIFVLSNAWAALRINGNQMVDAAGSYESSSARLRRAATSAPAAGSPGYLLFNLGQGLMGQANASGMPSSGVYTMGIGLIYDVNNVAYENYCPILMTGDVNLSASITSADIIYLVNFVFKGDVAPLPCAASGDVNLNGSVTSADIIYLVGYVFKGGPPPGNVCFLIPGVWTCP